MAHADQERTTGTFSKEGPGGPSEKSGGDDGDRTRDLGIANAALSQLSYVPSNELV